mmetsp:Transcript_20887/g.58739  ORF Transcript_20887/g.58739 Transcript_20887/m.58739 type:complete len:102 (-) Transcript_20887:86-391(-)
MEVETQEADNLHTKFSILPNVCELLRAVEEGDADAVTTYVESVRTQFLECHNIVDEMCLTAKTPEEQRDELAELEEELAKQERRSEKYGEMLREIVEFPGK